MDKNEAIELKAVSGRVVCSINLEGKNQHTFSNGVTIRLERQYDNFNSRETQPVNGIVIDAEHIPQGAEVLIGHNSAHDVNRIFDYTNLSGEEVASDVKYYSIPESECFLWRMGTGEWQPTNSFATALRVFRPYEGSLEGIGHQQLKDILYCTSGELKGKVVSTLKACDYEIIFQNEKGQEERKIRFRPLGDDETKREPEAIAILLHETKQVEYGVLLVGISPSDAKPLKQLTHA